MRKLMLFLMCLMVVAGSASAVIVNFDFQTWAGSSPASVTYTDQGALSDPGNNFWNSGGSGWDTFTANNLTASDGVTATTIDFASTITKFSAGDTSPLTNALMRDFKNIDTGYNPGQLNFSGLVPNAPYRFYLYAAGNQFENQGSKFTCNGITKETTGTVSNQFISGENYVILDTVSGPADANGVGNVIMTWELRAGATVACLNGFQIQPLSLQRGQAHTPVPAEFAAVFVPSTPSISWYSPEQDKNGVVVDDPNLTVTGYDVWLGTQEPNDVTGTPISTNQPGQSKTVSLAYGSTYYWRVDTHVAWDSNSFTGNFTDVVKGRVWKFTTRPSYIAPTVTFNNVITTQALLPANLSATVINNTETIVSVTFTLQTGDVFYPAGAIATLTNTTINKLNPTATLTTDKTGTYKINLAVFDGTNTVNKLAEVVVYADACAAKKASPSGWTASYYDRNGNCLVQLSDFVPLAVAWLNDTSLTAQMLY